MKTSAVSQIIKKIEYNSNKIDLFNEIIIQDSKCLFGDNNEYQIRVADTAELREQAYRLIYKIYLGKRFLTPHPSGMFFTEYDDNPQTTTIIVSKNTQVVGTLTINFCSTSNIPAEELYYDEISLLKSKGRAIAEVVSLGIDDNIRGLSTGILTKLFNVAYLICKFMGNIDEFIATVNPRHTAFYYNKLKGVEIGGLRFCQKVSGAPAKLLSIDLNFIQNEVRLLDDPLIRNQRTIFKDFITEKNQSIVLPVLKSQLNSMINNFGSMQTVFDQRNRHDECEIVYL